MNHPCQRRQAPCAASDSKWDLCNERWDALFSRTHWWLKLNTQCKVEDCNRYRVLKQNLNGETVMIIIIMLLIIIQVCQFGRSGPGTMVKTFHVTQGWKMFFWLCSSCNIERACKTCWKLFPYLDHSTLSETTSAKKNQFMSENWGELFL